MYRFLIVEDDRNAREQVTKYLEDTFPGALVLAAETVAEGEELIVKAEGPFDCVILDFKLPKQKGFLPDGDLSLCQRVREVMPTAIVAHVSAYLDDDAYLHDDQVLQEHYRTYHNKPAEPKAYLLPKNAKWVETLGKDLRQYLYGRSIGKQLDDLFGPQGQDASAWDGRVEWQSVGRPVRDTTYLLARVSHDIIARWEDLDEALKRRIHRLFRVVEEPGKPVRVGLL